MLSFPGVTRWLPLPAMAGSILLIAWNLIDVALIRQILRCRSRRYSGSKRWAAS